jgi:hypothetical protein
MFSQTTRKVLTPLKSTVTRASTVAARSGVFKEKLATQIWLGDAGAYPVMVGIIWCAAFGTGFGIYYATTSPDVRLWGQSRERLFRGAIAADYTKHHQ